MNVYLTGSHGTGKTTVANAIADKTEFGTVPSVARNSPHKPGTAENQRFIMDRVVHRLRTHEGTIHERTPLDVMAYTVLMDHTSEYNHQKMNVDAFLRTLEHMDRPIFYFPILFPLASDGVRPGKWEQVVVDTFIRTNLERSGVTYYTMPDGTPDVRADFILERVSANSEL